MNKRNGALVVLITGTLLLLLTMFGVYKDFFEPKIGPIGTGEYHWTTYATYISATIGSVIYIIYGVYLYMQASKTQ